MVLIEAVTRLLPDVLGNRDSAETDSFQTKLLASPIYTRPNVYRKYKVPQVLKSGNHRQIADWRRKKSLERTLIQRPDLLSSETFTKRDLKMLMEVLIGKNC